MNERDRLYLRHVFNAIAAIESFTDEGREQFMADRKTQSAVVRQIEIIGEAVKQLSAASPGACGPRREPLRAQPVRR